MKILEGIESTVAAALALVRVATQGGRLLAVARRLLVEREIRPSYENLSLEVVLDLRDSAGKRAIVERRQAVRFLAQESGVVRDLVWGEGEPLAHYEVSGARRLAVRREGSRQAVLLALGQVPRSGERAVLCSRRLVRGGFTQPEEYYELAVERPTQRLGLKVLFPRSRPPTAASLVAEPPPRPTQAPRRVSPRYTPDGRASLAWSLRRPEPYRVYRLRWCW